MPILPLITLGYLTIMPPSLAASMLREGGKTVFSSPSMRVIVIQNLAMALFFMGSFVVTIPLLVRDVFAGSSQDLAVMNGVNSLGLLASIMMLLRFGDVQRPGRALIGAHVIGSLALGAVGMMSVFAEAVGTILVWGLCGGVAMTMSRTIMQEQAPADQPDHQPVWRPPSSRRRVTPFATRWPRSGIWRHG